MRHDILTSVTMKTVKVACAHRVKVLLHELCRIFAVFLLQKHQRKSIARKCNKCTMWFVHKGILKEHQIKDHSSFKGVPGTFVDSLYAWSCMFLGVC
jgi:predicted metallopeptidase